MGISIREKGNFQTVSGRECGRKPNPLCGKTTNHRQLFLVALRRLPATKRILSGQNKVKGRTAIEDNGRPVQFFVSFWRFWNSGE